MSFLSNSTYGGGDPYSSSVRDYLGLPSMPVDQNSSAPANLDYSQWADYYGLTDNELSNGDYQLTQAGYIKLNENFIQQLVLLYNQGKISASDIHGYLNYLGYKNIDPMFEKWLDNQIALENTNSARSWEEQMASTDILRSANQLNQLGLSSSGVLTTGGSGVNPVGAADNVKTNMAEAKYNQRMGLTKNLISMVTGMASAGIGGAAMGLARNSLARMSMATAHNANAVLKKSSSASSSSKNLDQEWDRLMNEFKEEEKNYVYPH